MSNISKKWAVFYRNKIVPFTIKDTQYEAEQSYVDNAHDWGRDQDWVFLSSVHRLVCRLITTTEQYRGECLFRRQRYENLRQSSVDNLRAMPPLRNAP